MTNYSTFTPPGYATMNPYLIVEGAERLFAFIQGSFGGEVTDRALAEDGSVRHGAIRMGDSTVEFSDARPEWPAFPGAIHLYVPDTDAAYSRALENGAETLYEPAEMPYGERSAGVKDPTGNCWFIATYTGGGSEASFG